MSEVADAAQRARVRAPGWTKKTRARFFDALSVSGNVSEAVRAAGMAYTSAYALRRRDPAFAAAWAEALHAAYARIEDDLLARAISTCGGDGDTALALRMLTRHEAQARGRKGSRVAAAPRTASLDEVERALTRKLAALGKRLPLQP